MTRASLEEQTFAAERVRERFDKERINKDIIWSERLFSDKVTLQGIEKYSATAREYEQLIDDAHTLNQPPEKQPWNKHFPGYSEQITTILKLENNLKKAKKSLDLYLLSSREEFKTCLETHEGQEAERILKKHEKIHELTGNPHASLDDIIDGKKDDQTKKATLGELQQENLKRYQTSARALLKQGSDLDKEYIENVKHVSDWSARTRIKDLLTRVSAYAESTKSLDEQADKIGDHDIKQMTGDIQGQAEHLEHNVAGLYNRAKTHYKWKLAYNSARTAIGIAALASVVRLGAYGADVFTDKEPTVAPPVVVERVMEEMLETEKEPEVSAPIPPPSPPPTRERLPFDMETVQNFYNQHPEKKLIIYSDRDAQTIKAYDMRSGEPKLIHESNCIFGKNDGPKSMIGDKKTPEGAFNIEGVIIGDLPDLFGTATVMLSDRPVEGNGVYDGIVLAGTSRNRARSLQRLENVTNGGIVTDNDSVTHIARFAQSYGLAQTAIIIEHDQRPILRNRQPLYRK